MYLDNEQTSNYNNIFGQWTTNYKVFEQQQTVNHNNVFGKQQTTNNNNEFGQQQITKLYCTTNNQLQCICTTTNHSNVFRTTNGQS